MYFFILVFFCFDILLKWKAVGSQLILKLILMLKTLLNSGSIVEKLLKTVFLRQLQKKNYNQKTSYTLNQSCISVIVLSVKLIRTFNICHSVSMISCILFTKFSQRCMILPYRKGRIRHRRISPKVEAFCMGHHSNW